MAKQEKKKPKVVHRDYDNIADEQKYWDSLVDVYGKGVKGRQNYIKLATNQLPDLNFSRNRLRDENISGFDMPTTPVVGGDQNYSSEYSSLIQDYTEDKEDRFRGMSGDLNARQMNQASNYGMDFMDDYGTQAEADYLDNLSEEGFMRQPDSFNRAFNNPESQYKADTPRYQNLVQAVQSMDLDNPSLFLASMLDEGGDTVFTNIGDRGNSSFAGYDEFGLDTIGDRMDEFISKGYLPEDFASRIDLDPRANEKGDRVTSAYFNNLEDVMLAKKAFFQSGKDIVTNQFQKMGIEPTPQMLDYFTVSTFNLGEGGTKEMMEDYNKQGLLEGDKYLQDDATDSWRDVHRNVSRRMQAANMLVGEGVFDTKLPTGDPDLAMSTPAPTEFTFGGYTDTLYSPGGPVTDPSGLSKATGALSGFMSNLSPWVAAADIVGAGLSALAPETSYNPMGTDAASYDFDSNYTTQQGMKKEDTSSKIKSIPLVGGLAGGIFDMFGGKKASDEDKLKEYSGIARTESHKRTADLYAQSYMAATGGDMGGDYPHIGEIEIGGTHQQNPQDGVTISPGNLAEEGEYVANIKGKQFVFTNKF